MATVQNLVDSIAGRLRPWDGVEMSIGQLQNFVNDAVYDARNSGWLIILEDDESLTFANDTWEYEIPASFAYIHQLRIEDDSTTPSTWDEPVPRHFWDIRLDGAVPKFFFSKQFPLPVDKALKVIGQKRPTIYSSGATGMAQTVDPGFESFLRERAVFFAMGFMTTGNPQLVGDPKQLQIAGQSFALSEAFLARHPQENRVFPNSIYVPSR